MERIMSRSLSHPAVSVKRSVITRDGGFCLLALHDCQGEATTTDHRANRGSGGSRVLNNPVNLIAACAVCNGLKADAYGLTKLDLMERGLLVPPAATHEQTLDRARVMPVQDLAGEWWMLLSASERRPATEDEVADHLWKVVPF
jgi:hypothetical protein